MSERQSDVVRLPSGKTVTLARAIAAGWANKDGTLTGRAPASQQEQVRQAKADRARDWARRQGLDAPQPEAEEFPGANAALTGKPARKPKPLKPANVTPDGEEITDEALLADIAARTAAIEAAREVE